MIDGTDRICLAVYGRVGLPSDYIGGSDAKMLHDAAERIAELEKRIGELEAGHSEELSAITEQHIADCRELWAKIDAAEQALTAERKRREECEAALRPFAQLAKTQVMLGLNIADYKHAAEYFTRHSSSLNEPGNGRSG